MKVEVRKWVNICVGLSVLVNALIIVVIVSSCGGRNDGGYSDGGQPQAPAPDEGESWDSIKMVVDAKCGKCHNDTNQKSFDKDRLITSKALTRIENGTMPPTGKLDDDSKSRLVTYIKKNR